MRYARSAEPAAGAAQCDDPLHEQGRALRKVLRLLRGADLRRKHPRLQRWRLFHQGSTLRDIGQLLRDLKLRERGLLGWQLL